MVETVQRKLFSQQISPNPVSLEDVKKLVSIIQDSMQDSPSWLKSKLQNPSTVVMSIGGSTCVFNTLKLGLSYTGRSPTIFYLTDVWRCIETFAGWTEDSLSSVFTEQPDMVLPKLAILAAVLEKLCIREFRYTTTNGSNLGVLISDRFW